VKTLFIGLMSGTSLDGVDGVLVEFPGAQQLATAADSSDKSGVLHVCAHAHRPFEPDLAQQFLDLNRAGANELHHAALAANALAHLYADVVGDLLIQSAYGAHQVAAIGAHGQTVRHCPGEFDGLGYTSQINHPALLAELTGIDVVADFRSRDIAAGGQGAPLVPMFHRAIFGQADRSVAVLNIGGISNLSALHANGSVQGWDCGPGNVLMDAWCQQHLGSTFDHSGRWAASGQVVDSLLQRLMSEPYFARPVPKSTGRDLFHAEWLTRHLQNEAITHAPQNVQATLCELTAQACVNDFLRYAADSERLLVCGGGAHNVHLMNRLAALIAVTVSSTDLYGLPATQVEACAFAWLAKACVQRQAISLPSVTGAKGARILGAIYPGISQSQDEPTSSTDLSP
jgi:anhydro-N-acetylmuramic acid kinase